MFEVEFTADAVDDLEALRKSEQQTIFDQIHDQLSHQPTIETRNRKRLRPNKVAEYELRIGAFRIFYDVDEQAIRLRLKRLDTKGAIGYSFEARSMLYENHKCTHQSKDTNNSVKEG